MRYNKILRELIFAQNCAKCCYFAQKCYKTEAKVCVPFRKTCAKVLRTKTLILRTKIKGSAIKTIMIKYAKKICNCRSNGLNGTRSRTYCIFGTMFKVSFLWFKVYTPVYTVQIIDYIVYRSLTAYRL